MANGYSRSAVTILHSLKKEVYMDFDTVKVRELLDQRDAIDRQIQDLVTGSKPRATQKCSHCQQEGHSVRTCPNKLA